MNGPTSPLDSIVLVLWHTQDLVNIAGTIRAMKNFGLRNLRLVQPAEWDPWRIEGIAHDTSEIVERTRLFDDLAGALADCTYAVAMTARGRRAKHSLGRPRELAHTLLERVHGGAGSERIAIVFGREDRGLPNSALDLCQRKVTIPTNPEHPSLNLAQAVLVIAYELWLEHTGGAQDFKAPRRDAPPAQIDLLERTFTEIERALWTIDFFKSRQTEGVMRTLRGMAHRADLDEREAGFLLAMAVEVQKAFARALER